MQHFVKVWFQKTSYTMSNSIQKKLRLRRLCTGLDEGGCRDVVIGTKPKFYKMKRKVVYLMKCFEFLRRV